MTMGDYDPYFLYWMLIGRQVTPSPCSDLAGLATYRLQATLPV
jgi:hypothetical protein